MPKNLRLIPFESGGACPSLPAGTIESSRGLGMGSLLAQYGLHADGISPDAPYRFAHFMGKLLVKNSDTAFNTKR